MIYQDEFPEALALLEAGHVRTDRLLSQTFPLDRLDDAFQAHRSPDSIKVAVVPQLAR
jgi:threonine dehydrogenase-like Zn-dependent dehydrogenase